MGNTLVQKPGLKGTMDNQQPKQINLDEIRLRKSIQDRQQAGDMDDLVSVIVTLQKENAELKAKLEPEKPAKK